MMSLRRSMLRLKAALSQEKAETREMLGIYQRYVQGGAQPDEMKVANKQFFDLVKGLGLGVFAVLPFSPITIPVIVKLGKSVGVDILPSAFANMSDDQGNEPSASNHKQSKNSNVHITKDQTNNEKSVAVQSDNSDNHTKDT